MTLYSLPGSRSSTNLAGLKMSLAAASIVGGPADRSDLVAIPNQAHARERALLAPIAALRPRCPSNPAMDGLSTVTIASPRHEVNNSSYS